MIDDWIVLYGALLLRIAQGLLFVAHAELKYFVFTPAGTEHFFATLGVPPVLGLEVMAAEALSGLALIMGVCARLAARLTIPDMLGAIILVPIHNGFFFDNPNGGWEYPAFWTMALGLQALIGDGAFARAGTPSLNLVLPRRAVAWDYRRTAFLPREARPRSNWRQ